MGDATMRILLAFLCVLVLPACAMTETGFAPRSYYTIDGDIAALTQDRPATGSDSGTGTGTQAVKSDGSLAKYFDGTTPTEARRNNFIEIRLAVYDLEYERFTQNLRAGRTDAETIADLTVIGLSLATTLSDSKHAKTVLGAIITSFTGGRAAIEKNYYADRTTSALITQMDAERKAALIPILTGKARPLAEYSISDTIRDLLAYKRAGSIDGALKAVQKAATDKDEAASAALKEYRAVKFGADANTLRIRKYLFPAMVKVLDNQPIDASGAVIKAPDPAHLASVQAEMTKLNLGQVLVPVFMNAAAFADERAKVIAALNIP
ncbi:hypothetical protein P6144_03345 [Sphingomonas sp. HITSZ_GF]|uniref:hypothetical protein n=1 Tax=Sphingomonas sp. HITSZ_GF TaxID=3037247 RepID=UPI00240DC014|nr:hypothetical protein [Sphingomonas sp. HITSZ_GF]MDG2532669.1 hypothetical protein [Sphingomonas sp. HITSZ_GF]